MVPYYIVYNSYTDLDKDCEFDPETGMPIVTENGLTWAFFIWPENIIPDTTTFLVTTTEQITTEEITTTEPFTTVLTTIDPCNDVICLHGTVG